MKYQRWAESMVAWLLSDVFINRARSGCLIILVRKFFAMDRNIPGGINPNTNLITFDPKNSHGDIVTDDQ